MNKDRLRVGRHASSVDNEFRYDFKDPESAMTNLDKYLFKSEIFHNKINRFLTIMSKWLNQILSIFTVKNFKKQVRF
jgi:hypothetical protein